MIRFLVGLAAAASALVCAVPIGAAPPAMDTSHVEFTGPDEEASAACGFDVLFSLERTRTVTTFADGDVKRHTQLVLSWSANGKTLVEKATFNVFVASGSETWEITGTFAHRRIDGGGTILLASGRLLFDASTGILTDPNPGPHDVPTDEAALLQTCAVLAA